MSTLPDLLQAKPWYRNRWPWLLMLGPALVVLAGVATIVLAVRSDDGLVADDYYKQGLAINQEIARAERARELGLSALVDLDADGSTRVDLNSAASEADARPASIRVVIAHPTRAGSDVVATLVRTPGGFYAGRLATPPQGRARIIVESDAWRLPAAEVSAPLRGVRLSALPR
jgi:hypothetical protein